MGVGPSLSISLSPCTPPTLSPAPHLSPLRAVRVQQREGREAAQHGSQLPREVVRILQARVHAWQQGAGGAGKDRGDEGRGRGGEGGGERTCGTTMRECVRTRVTTQQCHRNTTSPAFPIHPPSLVHSPKPPAGGNLCAASPARITLRSTSLSLPSPPPSPPSLPALPATAAAPCASPPATPPLPLSPPSAPPCGTGATPGAPPSPPSLPLPPPPVLHSACPAK